MDAEHRRVAETSLRAAHDGSASFPAIVGALMAAGFEGYAVDYRSDTQTFYRPDGDTLVLPMPGHRGPVEPALDPAEMASLVRWAQANGPDYSYRAFSRKATAAGCAGYLVSFSGRRVVYWGRDGRTHVEDFPR